MEISNVFLTSKNDTISHKGEENITIQLAMIRSGKLQQQEWSEFQMTMKQQIFLTKLMSQVTIQIFDANLCINMSLMKGEGSWTE